MCRVPWSKISGIDPYVQSFFGLIRDLECQVRNVVAISLAICARDGQIGGKTLSVVDDVRCFVAGTCLRIGCGSIKNGWSKAWGRVDLRTECWYLTLCGS